MARPRKKISICMPIDGQKTPVKRFIWYQCTYTLAKSENGQITIEKTRANKTYIQRLVTDEAWVWDYCDTHDQDLRTHVWRAVADMFATNKEALTREELPAYQNIL